MERPSIAAESRDVGRKGLNRRLRNDGKVPAVLYGHGENGRGLSVNAKEIGLKIRSLGANALYNLQLEGQTEPVVVMVKDFQVDTLTKKLAHIDLVKVDMADKVTVRVTVKLVGKAVGQAKGGIVDLAQRELTVRCLPTRIPQSIDVDITALDMGAAIHVRDLNLPEGVEVSRQDLARTIVSVVAVKEEKPAEAAVAADAAAAPAAGAAAGAAAPAKAGEKAEKK